jgi:hypothetical protein
MDRLESFYKHWYGEAIARRSSNSDDALVDEDHENMLPTKPRTKVSIIKA